MKTASVSSASDRLHCREALTCSRPRRRRTPVRHADPRVATPIFTTEPGWRYVEIDRDDVAL